ncbi:MAG: hypothetical protein WBB19_11680 [Desulforhopalus sp.]
MVRFPAVPKCTQCSSKASRSHRACNGAEAIGITGYGPSQRLSNARQPWLARHPGWRSGAENPTRIFHGFFDMGSF